MIATESQRKTVVVIGNGMVGHRFCERLAAYDVDREFEVVTFCEEPRPAYDRVNLTKYFERRDAEHLKLACPTWYAENGITLHVGDRATAIDRERRVVVSQQGREVDYDTVVLATGSAPFVPEVPGVDKKGVFVYRTIEDLERILAYAGKSASAAVIGGGLLGLEAAKAVRDLGLETHVVEFAPRLMPRQVDDAGSKTLLEKIEEHERPGPPGQEHARVPRQRQGRGPGVRRRRRSSTSTWSSSRRASGPATSWPATAASRSASRGGVVVDDTLRTSDPDILAIGEVAWHRGMVYGLVAPGYEMADVAAANLDGRGADVLRLRHVDQAEADGRGRRQLRRSLRRGRRHARR